LDEEIKLILDAKLQFIRENINKKQEVSFTYFVPDDRKEGGEYVTEIGIVKKIDDFNSKIILMDKREIPINDLIQIDYK